MKYDDSEYYFPNFETGLAPHAANTHIGMYLAWAVQAGLIQEDASDVRWTRAIAGIRARQQTGAHLLSDLCDGKLTDRAFNNEGNGFTTAYYAKQFHHDYARVFDSQIPSTGHTADDICSVPDTWENFALLQPTLDQRLAQWRAGGSSAPADIAALRRRAEGGDGEAWYALAAEYLRGEHLPRDAALAADAFEKAAQAGVPDAAFNLGVCYQNGDGRPQDARERLRWFAHAAEGGHGRAAFFLATAYRRGDTVPQDFIAADALMLLARQRGVTEALDILLVPNRKEESSALADQMNQPGRLVALLSARRRDAMAARASDAGETQAVESRTNTSGWPRAALLIGAVNLLTPLLLVNLPYSRGITWLLAFIGAAGVYAVAPSRGFPGAIRVVLAAFAAALGALGGLIDLWMLLRKPRQAEP